MIMSFIMREVEGNLKEKTKKTLAGGAGGLAGAASVPTAVVIAAEGATSASALTTALASIGGSMLGGFTVLGVIAVIVGGSIYWLVRRLLK
jgi:hypothetical protein